MRDVFPRYHIGHFLNEPTTPRPFALTRFETMAEPEIEDPHRHDFYELLWTDTGFSRQSIDAIAYEVRAGSLFFISPGQLHLFAEYAELRGGSILFTETFFLLGSADRDRLFELSFLDNCYANPHLPLAAAEFAEVRETIALLEREAARPDTSAAVCRALLHVLLAQIQRCVNQQNAAPLPARRYLVLFKQLNELLEQHYLANLPPAAYAARLHITPHHLNVVCKAVTGGRTAGDVVRARALLEARRLLAFTDQPVAEVAARLGFLDPSYFARVFRAATGYSPAAYQRAMSEKYPVRSAEF